MPDGLEGTRLTYRMKSGYGLCYRFLYNLEMYNIRLSLFFSWIVSVSARGFVDSSLGLQVKSHREGMCQLWNIHHSMLIILVQCQMRTERLSVSFPICYRRWYILRDTAMLSFLF